MTDDRAALLGEGSTAAGVRFPRSGFGTPGYTMDEVDDFVDRVRATIDTALTAREARDVRFSQRRWSSGYDVDAVDAWIDRVEAYLTRNGR